MKNSPIPSVMKIQVLRELYTLPIDIKIKIISLLILAFGFSQSNINEVTNVHGPQNEGGEPFVKPEGLYLSSFKCLNRFVVEKIINYNGPYPYVDGLLLSVTSNIGSVETFHAKREIGKSGYSFFKLVKLYGNLMTNFSSVPIHIFSRDYDEGKKVRWWHFFTYLYHLIKWRFIS